jgi:dehydrogenase/reductase SDR family protein 4
LGHEGAKVVISSRKSGNVEEGIKSLLESGLNKSQVHGCVCHVASNEDRTKLLAETLKRFGRVDILVNNAGINPHFGDIMDVSESVWDKLFETNVIKNCYFLQRLKNFR